MWFTSFSGPNEGAQATNANNTNIPNAFHWRVYACEQRSNGSRIRSMYANAIRFRISVVSYSIGLLGYFRVRQQRRPPHKINTTCSSSHMHTIQIQAVCVFRSSCSYKKQPFRWLVSHPQFIYPFLSSTVSQSPPAFVCCMRAFRVYFALLTHGRVRKCCHFRHCSMPKSCFRCSQFCFGLASWMCVWTVNLLLFDFPQSGKCHLLHGCKSARAVFLVRSNS